jgi:hypothetical protein
MLGLPQSAHTNPMSCDRRGERAERAGPGRYAGWCAMRAVPRSGAAACGRREGGWPCSGGTARHLQSWKADREGPGGVLRPMSSSSGARRREPGTGTRKPAVGPILAHRPDGQPLLSGEPEADVYPLPRPARECPVPNRCIIYGGLRGVPSQQPEGGLTVPARIGAGLPAVPYATGIAGCISEVHGPPDPGLPVTRSTGI